MSPRDFCYWLQGVFEVHKIAELSAEQTKIVKNHLKLVFEHIDEPDPDGKLQATHDGHSVHPPVWAPRPPGTRC